METTKKKSIKDFTDLETWQEAHKLAVSIYKLTENFPREDDYGLKSQIRRSALSITSNIAEGFGRQSVADTARFYTMARGSLTELKNQLILARDIARINDFVFDQFGAQTTTVHKLLHGLMRSVQRVKSTSSQFPNTNSPYVN